MQRIKDAFLEKLKTAVFLGGKEVLEIGCGEGTRSVEIAQRCDFLVGIDPSVENIQLARERKISNAIFLPGSAQNLDFDSTTFDVIIFTLSLHHVPASLMMQAINEAVRVVRQEGFIVFLEPGMQGSLFDAEIKFDAYDGDEREVKKGAYRAMMEHQGLKHVTEIPDESVFQFDSLEDFMTSMNPKKEIDAIEPFLAQHDYTLNAERRINIFTPARAARS